MKCSNCGAENFDETPYCPICGFPMHPAKPQIPTTLSLSDLNSLCNEIAGQDYIANLRVGRSWVLPQLLKMGFYPATTSS